MRNDSLTNQDLSADSEPHFSSWPKVLNAIEVGVTVVSPNLRLEYINDTYRKMVELPDDIGPGDAAFELYLHLAGRGDFGEGDPERLANEKLREIASGSCNDDVHQMSHGKINKIRREILDDGFIVSTMTDITEFKQREVALESAQAHAQSADRSKSEFLANMSHEIRTPMNGVMGMAELLAKSELDTKQRMFTDVILSSSTALLTIINDILDFSKIEAGKLELNPSAFCLSSAIEDIASLVSTSVTEKNLELIVRIQPDLPDQVVGDVGRIRQILTNLIGNAVKFTEKGHILVDVSGGVMEDSVGLRIAVTDTGIGIPEDKLQSVFEKFSQVDGSSTRRHEGTGLGLAITCRLVELMGGDIGNSSTLGEGSSFWIIIELPIDRSETKRTANTTNINDARILAIEDNSVNRSILMEQFDAWNMTGTAAASGLEGLAMMRQAAGKAEPFEAVVLDYHMPDMNGVDVARVIRSDEQLSQTPIIMLTSVDTVGDSAEFRELNIDAHLVKPARASHLLENIIDVVAVSRGSANNFRAESSGHGEAEALALVHFGNQTANAPSSGGDEQNIDIAGENEKIAHDVRSLITDAETVLRKNNDQAIALHNDDADQTGVDILVAEDNKVNQMVFEHILDHLNYTFKIVENGKLAVDEVEVLRPAIVLMDVSMPVMNGLEATAEIRKIYNDENSSAYRPTIIGVTAHALKDDREKCMAAGMDDYLAKPISPDLLAEKIKNWMPVNAMDRAIA